MGHFWFKWQLPLHPKINEEQPADRQGSRGGSERSRRAACRGEVRWHRLPVLEVALLLRPDRTLRGGRGKGWERRREQTRHLQIEAEKSAGAERRELGVVSSGAVGPPLACSSAYGHFRGTTLLRLVSEEVGPWGPSYTLSVFILASPHVVTHPDAHSSDIRAEKGFGNPHKCPAGLFYEVLPAPPPAKNGGMNDSLVK